MLKRIFSFLVKFIIPRWLVAACLSLRWKCRVSPRAKIIFPENLVLGKGARVDECVIIADGKGVRIGSNSEIHFGVILDTQQCGFIEIGDSSGIGPYSIVYGFGGVKIGDGCAVAGQSMIVASNHRFEGLTPVRDQGVTGLGITIGDNTWIGANCVILDGATVGDGSVIGACSLVKGAIASFSIAFGSPAVIKRKRGNNA